MSALAGIDIALWDLKGSFTSHFARLYDVHFLKLSKSSAFMSEFEFSASEFNFMIQGST